MAALPAILAIASTAVTAIGALQSASAEQRAAKYNEALAQQNAQLTRQAGAIQEEQHRRQVQKIIGHNRAQDGASGVTMEGTPLDVLADIASQGERDAQIIRYNTDVSASGHQSTAGLFRSRAEDSRTAGFIGAGQAILLHAAHDASRTGSGFKIPAEASDDYAP